MAYEILKSIVEAEARAVEIKKQAVVQEEKMKADAIKQQESLLEEAKLQGKKEMQEALEALLRRTDAVPAVPPDAEKSKGKHSPVPASVRSPATSSNSATA
jgi:hypothetical protein